MVHSSLEVKLPNHLLENEIRLKRLSWWAHQLHQEFFFPVLLCGSALRENNSEPRDWDIRVVLSDEAFASRFGSGESDVAQEWVAGIKSGQWSPLQYRWSDECVRKTKIGWKRTQLNIDFQIYPLVFSAQEYSDASFAVLSPQ